MFCSVLLWCYLVIFIAMAISSDLISENEVDIIWKAATDAIMNPNNYDENIAISLLEKVVALDSRHFESIQLLGALYLKHGKLDESKSLLETAVQLSNWRNVPSLGNLIESYRQNKDYMKAYDTGLTAYRMYPTSSEILKNFALVLVDMQYFQDAIRLYTELARLIPQDVIVWETLIQVLIEQGLMTEAQDVVIKALKYHPHKLTIVFQYGAILHMMQKLDDALTVYLSVYNSDPMFVPVLSNLGAVYQSLGNVESALFYYNKALTLKPDDPGILNNYGSLLGLMNRKQDEVYYLMKALELEPNLEHSLINLGGYYQDNGDIELSKSYLLRGLNATSSKSSLVLRIGTMLSPISSSWNQMLSERLFIERNLLLLNAVALENKELSLSVQDKLDSNSDRIHFYIVYHGLNDRYLQELFIQSYHIIIKGIDNINPTITPHLPDQYDYSVSSTGISSIKKVRVAFISKYFGILTLFDYS